MTGPALSTQPARIGRPQIPILHSELERLAGLGLNVEQIADRLGCSRRTIHERMSRDPAYREAMDRGLSKAVEAAATIVQAEVFKGNWQAAAWFLKTRGGFHTPKPAPEPAAPPPPGDQKRFTEILGSYDAMRDRQNALLAAAAAQEDQELEGHF